MDSAMLDLFRNLSVAAVLGLILWTGYKGGWYFGRNARAVIDDLKRERDSWRAVAVAQLRAHGLDVPVGSDGLPVLPQLPAHDPASSTGDSSSGM